MRGLAGRLLKPLLALVLLVVGLLAGGLAANHPPLLEPPGVGVRLLTYLTRNSVETDPFSPFPERRTTRYAVAPQRLYDAALAETRARGWQIVQQDSESWRIEAVAATPVWGFRDDVVIMLRAPGGGPTELHLRSSSRTGRGDLGANTRRIIDLRRAIEERLPAAP